LEWLEYLRELNIASCVVRIALAMLFGGVIGIERGRKKRAAGFRTYMLVSIGATLVMMTNQYAYNYFSSVDPVRLGAQVISGIGFLGAGTIILTARNQIKGITTAAGLWTAACSGLAIGIGFYEGALIGGSAIFCAMVVLHNMDSAMQHSSRVVELYLEYDSERPFSTFLDYARAHQFSISDIQLSKNKLASGNALCATIIAKSSEKLPHQLMMETLSGCPGIQHMEEL
jgi:putative Mg2+ transporter-C (MgtC) family protein